jgi:mitogen-activated protein kinase kinase
MSEGIGSVRTLKRKNVKGLALAAPPPRTVTPSESDLQVPGGIDFGNDTTRQTAQLEIGIEYKLDLKREDLLVLKDLGHGNGGTVSKVKHLATGTIMARKVSFMEFAMFSGTHPI